jgi:CubicO group peptidase (beta-lactamase class C family)
MSAAHNLSAIESKFKELIEYAKEAMQREHVPGLGIGLYVDGQEYVEGLGITSIENPLPVTPPTLFQIGSITKTYTTTALMRLLEQGKFSLEDKVRKFIPDFKVQDEAAAAGATMRHLLNHTAGWLGDYFFVSGHGDDNLVRYVASLKDLEQFTPLGEVFTYNNTSFNIAGRVLEVLTGKTFEAAVRELVLDPLEMSSSYFFPMEVMVHRFVVGHVWNEAEGKWTISTPWTFERCENPAGGLVSNVFDQLKYARFHMGDGTNPKGERLLKPETLQLMQTPTVKGDMTMMGFNWFIWDIGGERFIDHDGSTGGQQAALWFSPKHKLAFTVLTNENQGYVLHADLTRRVRKEFLGVVEEEPKPIALSAEALNEYAGDYKGSSRDLFNFRPHEGGLIFTHIPAVHEKDEFGSEQAIPPMRCAMIEADRFIFLDLPFKGWKFDFLRGKDGKIVYLRFSGRVMART